MSNQLERTNGPATAKPEEGSSTILSLVERAAANPEVDVDKMGSLLKIREATIQREAEMEFTRSFALMQENLPIVEERGEIKIHGKIHSTYALWEDINQQIKPVLTRYGFALSFKTAQIDSHVIVTGILTHTAGHKEETTLSLPVDSSGAKNAVQAIGSSVAYGKRYTAGTLLNLTSRGEDDDGQAAGRGALISDTQVQELIELADAAEADKGKFCAFLGVPSFADIPANRFQHAKDALAKKQRSNGSAKGGESGTAHA